MFGYVRIMVGSWPNRLYIAAIQGFSADLDVRISWQAQYLVMLDGSQCCSAHCKSNFRCDEDQS